VLEISIPGLNDKFTLNASDPPTANVVLNAATGPSNFLIDWLIEVSYKTRGGFPEFKGSPATHRTQSNRGESYALYNQGGKVDLKATIATNTRCSDASVFYIDGTNPGERAITGKLVALYANSPSFPPGGTENLLTGVADKESNYQQFRSFTHPTYNILGSWPYDNDEAPDGSGGYVGLLQVPTEMATAFSWVGNAERGLQVLEEKLGVARRNEQQRRSDHPQLPPLTATQLEDNALIKYGPHGNHGYYWIPNSAANAWIKNPQNQAGVDYVDSIRARAAQHPWP
jgi:hypothetical protein